MTDLGSSSTFSFKALGTMWWITSDTALNDHTKQAILGRVYEFQDTYSRFNQESLLSKLNNCKQLKNPPSELVAMLRYALDTYQKTDGLFNISVGAQLEHDGYGMQTDNLARVSYDLVNDIAITTKKVTIADHIRLDFGGFGKGWLIDSLHKMLDEKGYPNHIVNGGGDMRVGAQSEQIHIESPFTVKETIGTVRLQNQALAVSSNKKRQWLKDGVMKHHIINPKTKSSVTDALQVATTASTCLDADVCATLLLLSGDNPAVQQFAAAHGVAYLVVLENQRALRTKNFAS